MKSTKTKRIEAERKRLMQFYVELPENKLELVTPLIENAAFMKVTLDDLQDLINESGVTDEYQNGENQRGRKISADIQAYNSTMKMYTAVIDRLAKMLPPMRKKSKLEELTDE